MQNRPNSVVDNMLPTEQSANRPHITSTIRLGYDRRV